MSARDFFEQFRDLKIDKRKLCVVISNHEKLINPVIVSSVHLKRLLEAFQVGIITEEDVLNWVNVIWFSDCYEYEESQCDIIASIMNELEEIDEGKNLTPEKVSTYIQALVDNREI